MPRTLIKHHQKKDKERQSRQYPLSSHLSDNWGKTKGVDLKPRAPTRNHKPVRANVPKVVTRTVRTVHTAKPKTKHQSRVVASRKPHIVKVTNLDTAVKKLLKSQAKTTSTCSAPKVESCRNNDSGNFFGCGPPPCHLRDRKCLKPKTGDSWTNQETGETFVYKNGCWHPLQCCLKNGVVCFYTQGPSGQVDDSGSFNTINYMNFVSQPCAIPNTGCLSVTGTATPERTGAGTSVLRLQIFRGADLVAEHHALFESESTSFAPDLTTLTVHHNEPIESGLYTINLDLGGVGQSATKIDPNSNIGGGLESIKLTGMFIPSLSSHETSF